jgi:hypothetical protein
MHGHLEHSRAYIKEENNMANESVNQAGLSQAEQSRREFVKAAGKLAVYVPPTLMLLMKPTPNAIAESAGRFQETNDGCEKDGWLFGTAPEHDESNPHFSLDR